MEYIDDPPLKAVREHLPLLDRLQTWSDVVPAFDAAEPRRYLRRRSPWRERAGEMVRRTVIDFGSSALAGQEQSLKRHAKLVHRFVHWLLPVGELVPHLDIPGQVRPEYVLVAEGYRVDAATTLMRLDTEIDALTPQQVRQRLSGMANNHSTALLDLVTPVSLWFEGRGVANEHRYAYTTQAQAEVERRQGAAMAGQLGPALSAASRQRDAAARPPGRRSPR